MSDRDNARRLSLLEVSVKDDVGRLDSDPPIGSPSFLASTTSLGSYPTSPSAYFACYPLTLLGTEVEGGSGVVTQRMTSPFFALNLGTSVPPSGTPILVTFVGNRWVFRYDA